MVAARVGEPGGDAHEGLVGAKREGGGDLDALLADALLGHGVYVIGPHEALETTLAIASTGPVAGVETETDSGSLTSRSSRGGE